MPSNNNTVVPELTLEESIKALRSEIAHEAKLREEILKKINDRSMRSTRAVQVTAHAKNVVGAVGLTFIVTAGMAEAVGFTAAKMAGLDYEFGSAVKALLNLGKPRTE